MFQDTVHHLTIQRDSLAFYWIISKCGCVRYLWMLCCLMMFVDLRSDYLAVCLYMDFFNVLFLLVIGGFRDSNLTLWLMVSWSNGGLGGGVGRTFFYCGYIQPHILSVQPLASKNKTRWHFKKKKQCWLQFKTSDEKPRSHPSLIMLFNLHKLFNKLQYFIHVVFVLILFT